MPPAASVENIGVEAVLMSWRDRDQDTGQIGQGQARGRLTPSSQGISGAGPQEHQEVMARHAGASGNLMGAFHSLTKTFRSSGRT